MTSLPSKPKQQRKTKTKTSILFQVKQNKQHNIEFGQSMNIISLNTNNKINKRNTEINSNKYSNVIQCNTSTNINKNNVSRVYQSAKFSFKVNQNTNSGEDDENRIMSIYNDINTQKKLEKVNISQLIEKYQKRHLINWEKNKIVTDLDNFTFICVEFLDKIEGLQVQNIEMIRKIKRYQNYFKQLKVKKIPQVLDLYLQTTSTKQQKNFQLKILNLQRKIQILNYIIKNYRCGNKEQIKQFQKKLNEYKPTIQSQLLQILTQSNIKCQELSKLVQYFNKQYGKYCHQGNWVQLVRSLYDKDEKIKLLGNRNIEILQQCGKLQAENNQAKVFKLQLQKMNKQNMEFSFQLNKLKTNYEQLNAQKLKKQIQNDEILRKLQDLSYKYQALLFIQPKLKQKQVIIRKNTQTINRIQNQNLVLINKMGALIKKSQIQLFNKQHNSIETIEKCSITIEELTNRFKEQLQAFADENKELTSFIMHLHDKTKNSFQKIVEQYQKQLKKSYLQNKQLINRLNTFMTYNQKRQQFCKDLFIQIQNIQTKRKRCQQSQSKILIKQQCNSCLNWILHWGQLNSLYTQLLGAVKNLNQKYQ